MKPQESTLRVALYIRVSTEDQVEKFGIPMQKDTLLLLLKSRGKLKDGSDAMVLAGDEYIYVDEGVSGTTPLDERPAFQKLKEDIFLSGDKKPFDIVAVYKIDRFARKLKILLDVVDFFEEYRIDFMSANEMIDTSTPFGKAMLNIIGVIAELERETTALRTKDGREQAQKSGKVMGASAKYGYKKGISGTLELFEEEAKYVREIFDLFVENRMTAYQIALHFTERGLPSPSASAVINKKKNGMILKKNSNEHWKPEKIRDILGDEIYLGKFYYNKIVKRKPVPREEWKLANVSHEPIIDDGTFSLAQKYLESSKHERVNKNEDEHTYLLSGLLVCSHCFDREKDKSMAHWNGGRKEVKKGSKNFTYFYQCSRKNKSKSYKPCFSLPFPADGIEEYIKNYTFKLLENPKIVYEYNQKLLSTKSEIKKTREMFENLKKASLSIDFQKERLKEQHLAGVIKSIQELNEKISELNERQKKLNEKMIDLEKRITQDITKSSSLKTLELFSEKYKETIEKAKTDRIILYQIIHKLFEEIVIYTREIEEFEPIAGKRKEGQVIPNKIHLKVRLPKEIMNEEDNKELKRIFNSPDGVQGKNPLFVRNRFSHGILSTQKEDNIILFCYNLDKEIKRIGQNKRQIAYEQRRNKKNIYSNGLSRKKNYAFSK